MEDRSSMDDIRHPSPVALRTHASVFVRRLPPVTARHLPHPSPHGDGEGVMEEARSGEFRNNRCASMAAIAQSRTLFSPGCCSSSNGSRKKLNDLKNLSSWSFVRATTKRGGAAREVWRSTGLVCRAEGNGDGRKENNNNENEMENPFDLEKEMEKVLESEESKTLLRDLAAAAERVSAKRKELDDVARTEKKVEELQVFLERLDANQAAADSVVAEVEEEVVKAEASVRAAERALVTARSGGSANEVSSKWETAEIDEDAERIESGKAAAVSAFAGTLASLPFSLAVEGGLSFGTLLSQAGILVSCALFGVTFRYAVRRDLGNLQLKSGVAAAFGVVRGIAQIDATQALVGFPETGIDKVLKASLEAGESMIIFITAALALDYCLSRELLSPFPSKKSH